MGLINNLLVKSLVRKLPVSFLMAAALSCSFQSFACEFDFDAQPPLRRPAQKASAEERASVSREGLLSAFNDGYTLQSVRSTGSGAIKIRVGVDGVANQTKDFNGALVVEHGVTLRTIALKHRFQPIKPVVGGDNNLEPLLRWYSDTLSYDAYAIQIVDDDPRVPRVARVQRIRFPGIDSYQRVGHGDA